MSREERENIYIPLCKNCEETYKTLHLKTMFEVRHGFEHVALLCTYFVKLQLRCALLDNVQYCNVPIGDFV